MVLRYRYQQVSNQAQFLPMLLLKARHVKISHGTYMERLCTLAGLRLQRLRLYRRLYTARLTRSSVSSCNMLRFLYRLVIARKKRLWRLLCAVARCGAAVSRLDQRVEGLQERFMERQRDFVRRAAGGPLDAVTEKYFRYQKRYQSYSLRLRCARLKMAQLRRKRLGDGIRGCAAACRRI